MTIPWQYRQYFLQNNSINTISEFLKSILHKNIRKNEVKTIFILTPCNMIFVTKHALMAVTKYAFMKIKKISWYKNNVQKIEHGIVFPPLQVCYKFKLLKTYSTILSKLWIMAMQQKAVPVALFSRTKTHVTLPATEQRLGVPAGPGFDFMFFTKDTISLFSVFIIRQGVTRSRCAGNGKCWVCCRWCLSVTYR